MGQSCGGFMSITLGADPRVDTIGVFNSGIQRPNPGEQPAPGRSPEALAALHGPVLIIDGHEPDFMWEAAQATFEMINQRADLLRLPAQRWPHRDGLSPGRRRVRERCVELAQVDLQR